jgi:hypothetical protein
MLKDLTWAPLINAIVISILPLSEGLAAMDDGGDDGDDDEMMMMMMMPMDFVKVSMIMLHWLDFMLCFALKVNGESSSAFCIQVKGHQNLLGQVRIRQLAVAVFN